MLDGVQPRRFAFGAGERKEVEGLIVRGFLGFFAFVFVFVFELEQVKIPAGVEDGNKLRVKGEGDAGAKGGPTGDLYVFLGVKSHPVFRRSGKDIYSEKKVRSASCSTSGRSIGRSVVFGVFVGFLRDWLELPWCGVKIHMMFRPSGKSSCREKVRSVPWYDERSVSCDVPSVSSASS